MEYTKEEELAIWLHTCCCDKDHSINTSDETHCDWVYRGRTDTNHPTNKLWIARAKKAQEICPKFITIGELK